MTRRIAVLGLFSVLVGAGSLLAHHSYGDVLRDQSISVQGKIDKLLFANPHVMLTIKTEHSGSFTAEWQSLPQLQRAGITAGTLKVGDAVIVTGSPTQKSESTLKLLTEVRRTSDGWAWSVPLGRRGGAEAPESSVTKKAVK